MMAPFVAFPPKGSFPRPYRALNAHSSKTLRSREDFAE
jgi:hypothetical protein